MRVHEQAAEHAQFDPWWFTWIMCFWLKHGDKIIVVLALYFFFWKKIAIVIRIIFGEVSSISMNAYIATIFGVQM